MSEIRYIIDSRTFLFDAGTGSLNDADGQPVLADVVQLSAGEFSILLEGRSFHLFVDDRAEERTVTLQNKKITVLRETLRDRLSKQLQKGSGTASHAATVKAPMPGLITKILRPEGSPVSHGDGVLVIEAMKMENEIKAPRNGIIKRIHVKERQTAEKNDQLFTIE